MRRNRKIVEPDHRNVPWAKDSVLSETGEKSDGGLVVDGEYCAGPVRERDKSGGSGKAALHFKAATKQPFGPGR